MQTERQNKKEDQEETNGNVNGNAPKKRGGYLVWSRCSKIPS
jgi:hypothetical protein